MFSTLPFISLETVIHRPWIIYTTESLLMTFERWAEPGRGSAAVDVENLVDLTANGASGMMVTNIIVYAKDHLEFSRYCIGIRSLCSWSRLDS